jgi:hypothetical protein
VPDPYAAIADPVTPAQTSDPYAAIGDPVDTQQTDQPALQGFTPEEQTAIRGYLPRAKDAADLVQFAHDISSGQRTIGNAQQILDYLKGGGDPSQLQFTDPVAAQAPAQKTGVMDTIRNAISDGIFNGLDAVAPGIGSFLRGHQAAGKAFTEHAANALVGDYGPEVGGFIHTLVSPSEWSSFGSNLDNNVAHERAILQGDSEGHGIASAGGELTGIGLSAPLGGEVADSLGAGKLAASLGKYGNAIVNTGRAMGEGAVYGSGAAGPGDRLSGAVEGAALAPIVGAAFKVPGMLYRAGESVLGASPNLARKIIANAIEADANTPQQVGQAISDANANGVPMMIADTGENVRGLLAASGRTSGPARTLARDALEERQAGLADRVTQAIERDLGPVVNPHEVADTLMTKAQTDAAPAYQNFYSQGAVKSPALDNLLQRPSMQTALNKAYRIAAEEGRDPEAMGLQLDQNGNVALHPMPIEAMDKLQAAREAYDQAASGLASAQQKAAAGGSADIGSAEAAVKQASDNLDAAKAEMAATPRGGSQMETKTYSPQTIDYIKRGMDDIVESYRDPVTGKLNLDTEGRAINNTLRAFQQTADKLYPQWEPARNAWGGPVAGINAMNLGRKSLNMTADDLEARMRDMTPFQKQMAALGARRAMAELVASKGDSADVVNALVGTGKKRAMLARLFGDRPAFQRFVDTLGQEREGFRTFKQALTGSPTAANLQDDKTLQLASATIEAALSGGVPWRTALGQALKFGVGKAGNKAKQQVAALLSNTDPANFRELASELQGEMARRGLVSNQTRVAGRIGGNFAASTVNAGQ